jgi:serine/threonine protein kinase
VTQILDEYDMGEICGHGKFSQVFKSIHKRTGNEVAIKVIEKEKLDEVESSFLNTELAIIKVIQHPLIVELIDVFEDAEKIFIVLEFIHGGEMFNYLVDRIFI